MAAAAAKGQLELRLLLGEHPETGKGGRTGLADGVGGDVALSVGVNSPRSARLGAVDAGAGEVADGLDGSRSREEDGGEREDAGGHGGDEGGRSEEGS